MLMATDDFFRSRADQMIDLRYRLVVSLHKMPWDRLEESLRPVFEHCDCKGHQFFTDDMFVQNLQIAGAGLSNAVRPRLPIRLMV